MTDTDRERARLLIEEAVAWGRHNIPTPGALLMHWRIERALRDKIAAALAEARRGALLTAVDIALNYDVGAAGHSNLAVAHNAAMNIAGEIRRALASPAPDQGTT